MSLATQPMDALRAQIQLFQTQLLEAAPQLSQGLTKVHALMQAHPELGHAISDEEIGVIVSAMLKEKNIVLAAKAKKSEPSTSAKLKALLADSDVEL